MSPLAHSTGGSHAYARPPSPDKAPCCVPATLYSHTPDPHPTLHAHGSLPSPARPKPEAPRTKSAPSSVAFCYPQNVYPYNPTSRAGSDHSSQAYSQPGQPLSRGPSGSCLPTQNPIAAPVSYGPTGASRISAHGHSGQSSQYDTPFLTRAPDSAGNVPSPPSSYHHPHSPSPPERIQSRFTSKVPRSLMSSRDSAHQYAAPNPLSTFGSSGTAGGGAGGASFSSGGGSAARGHSKPASGNHAVRQVPSGAVQSCERDGLCVVAPASAAAHQHRQLGSPLLAAKPWLPAAEATAAGGIALMSDLETNHGSAAVDTSSRRFADQTQASVGRDTRRGLQLPAVAVSAQRKPPLRISLPITTATDTKEAADSEDVTRDLTASLAWLDGGITVGGDTTMSDHRFTHTHDSGPLPDTLKPSSAKGTQPLSRASSSTTQTWTVDPGPAEPPRSAKLHSSRPSSSTSPRATAAGTSPGACAGADAGFVSITPEAISPQPQSPTAAEAHPPAPAVGAACRTVTLDDTSSSVGMSHAQLCRALDALTARRAVLQGRYLLRGHAEQRLSGQGVVQFAETRATEDAIVEAVAVKFYLVHAAFDRVASLWSQRALAGVTGAVVDATKGSAISGCDGVFDGTDGALPPMVVTRRGLTLEEWVARVQPPTAGLARALAAACARLAELHACGYVYYAMKPSNVAWLEWGGGWQLIDFGRATRAGATLARVAPACLRCVHGVRGNGSLCVG